MNDDVVIVPTIFGVFGWIVWTISTNIRRSKTAREIADLHAKLLDKFAASQELQNYIESDAGRRFLESASTGYANPSGRILNAVQAGTILSLVGLAGLLVRATLQDTDLRQFLIVAGSIVLAIGIGFLVSALISYGLCKSWGLLNRIEARK